MALRDFLLVVALAATAATPALAQEVAPSVVPTNSAKESAASVPDFGTWVHGSIPGFEPLSSGPTSLVNRSRRSIAQLLRDLAIDWGGPGEPPSEEGVSNLLELVGDYTNPILRPWAADVVKKFGELSSAGVGVPSPRNQCWPGGVPFTFTGGAIQILQQPDKITIFYGGYNNEVRRVRLNEPHQSPTKPSWYGDSVGHYEGDTLVIDTVAVKSDRKYAMIDLFGTPYSDKLHIVERYRLRDYDDVKDALERNKKENWLLNGDVWSGHRGEKFLQLHVTIEDEGVFTTAWTATLTYAPGDRVAESVCAENPNEYYNHRDGRSES